MAGQESNEGNEDARFFSRFLEEDRRRCEDECQTRTQPDSGDDDHLGNTQMLSNAGMISEIYSFLQTIEPKSRIEAMKYGMSKHFTLKDLCQFTTNMRSVSLPELFTNERLQDHELEFALFNALTCSHPELTRPDISRLSRENTSADIIIIETWSNRRVQRNISEVSVRERPERVGSVLSDTEDNSSMSSARARQRQWDARSQRDNQVCWRTLYDYLNAALASLFLEIRRSSEIEEQSRLSCPETATLGSTRYDINQFFIAYANDRSELQRLVIRLVYERKNSVEQAHTSARTPSDTSAANNENLTQSRIAIRSMTVQGMHVPLGAERAGRQLPHSEFEWSVDENLRALNSRYRNRSTVNLNADFEDRFVRSVIQNCERYYFFLLCSLVAHEVKLRKANSGDFEFSLTDDVFDVSATADGRVILNECRQRLLISDDFHKVAYLGALVKSYDLDQCVFYFSHTACIFDLHRNTPLSATGLEREILSNASCAIVNQMRFDLSHRFNKFPFLFDTNKCIAWLRLFNAALRLETFIGDHIVEATEITNDIVRQVKKYCGSRIAPLQVEIARLIDDRQENSVAVAFARTLVLAEELEQLNASGVSRAFQTVCNVNLTQLLAQIYFFDCLQCANKILDQFLSTCNKETETRTFAEHLAFVSLLKQLETCQWSSWLAFKYRLSAEEERDRVLLYDAFVNKLSKFWQLALSHVIRECCQLQVSSHLNALRSETLSETFRFGSVRFSLALHDCLVLLRRLTLFYIQTAELLFSESHLPNGVSTDDYYGLLQSDAFQTSGYVTDEVQRIQKPAIETPTLQNRPFNPSNLRYECLRDVSHCLLLPFIFDCAYLEFAHQPVVQLTTALAGHDDALWKQFTETHCVTRLSLLKELLDRQLDVTAPVANNTGHYKRFLIAIQHAHINKHPNLDIYVQQNFLREFTRSLACRLNDLQLLSRLAKLDVLQQLTKHNDLTRVSQGIVCPTCNLPMTQSSDQQVAECRSCSLARTVLATVSSASHRLGSLACQLIVAHCARTYDVVFSCSYSLYSCSAVASLNLHKRFLDRLTCTQVDVRLFPAAYLLHEIVDFCITSLMPDIVQQIVSSLVQFASQRLRVQYLAFLQKFASSANPCISASAESMHTNYIRFNVEHLLVCTRACNLVLPESTSQNLNNLVSTLELHAMNVEQLLFVWCVMQIKRDCNVTQMTEESMVKLLATTDFVSLLSPLFKVFRHVETLPQRFKSAVNARDSTWLKVALRAYTVYPTSGLCVLDVLRIIWLRRHHTEDPWIAVFHKNVNDHKVKEVERHLQAALSRNSQQNLPDGLLQLINQVALQGVVQNELAQLIESLARRPNP